MNTSEPSDCLTLDQAQRPEWRAAEVNGYVVKDYTNVTAADPAPVIAVIKGSEALTYISEAVRAGSKIAVYAIGDCVCDLT